MRRAFVVTFAAGAVLGGAACKEPPDDTPVRKPADKPVTTATTTAPEPKPSGLPRLEDLKSPHPPGATNPPSLYLIVTPEGKCFGRWEGGMLASKGDRVDECEGTGCTEVQCPPKAKELLTAYSAATIIHKNPPNPKLNPPPPTIK